MNMPAQKETSVEAYSEFRNQLAVIKKNNESLVFDYTDPKGNKEARSHVYSLRQTKAAIEKARVAAKAEALEYGRKVDSEAKELVSEVEQMIEVHAKPLEEIEKKEAARVAAIEGRMQLLIDAIGANMELTAADLGHRLFYVESVAIDDTWEEFAASAAKQKDTSVSALREKLAKQQRHEAEQAELQRLRQQQAEREQKDRDEAIAREAAEKATREANEKAAREAREIADKAEQSRKDAEAREIQLKLEKETAERKAAEAIIANENRIKEEKRIADERVKAERERLEREQQEQRDKEAKETERREANIKHCAKINNAAKDALVYECGITTEQAIQVIKMIASKKIPNVTITY